MEIPCKTCLIPISSPFHVFDYDLIIFTDFPIAKLEAQYLMSQIRSRTEYLIPTYNILLLVLNSN